MLGVVKRHHFEPRLSLLNSMLFTFSKLSRDSSIQDNNIIQVQQDLLLLIISAIKKGNFVNIDILLLREIKNTLSADLYKEYENYLEPLLSSIDTSALEMEELNNELWWYFIYELNVLPINSIRDIGSYVDQKLLDYSYDIEIINKQFSILGLFLMKYNNNFLKYQL